MNTPSVSAPVAQPPKPWYKEAYVWLVVAGPLTVVVASFFTIYLAVSHPDPVLERPKSVMQGGAGSEPSDEALAAQRAVMPATEARNHASSSALPKDR